MLSDNKLMLFLFYDPLRMFSYGEFKAEDQVLNYSFFWLLF